MISTVAVGADGSATSSKAVEFAAELALRFDAELVLVSAFSKSGGGRGGGGEPDESDWAVTSSSRVREILTRAEHTLERKGISCRTLVDEGDPADVLVRLAADCDADLLVIGNKGMGRKILGSVPNSVTHKAHCSVVVVKTT